MNTSHEILKYVCASTWEFVAIQYNEYMNIFGSVFRNVQVRETKDTEIVRDCI